MPTKLGQNFLRDNKIIGKIIQAANLQPDDFVIEIGPGEGVLTEALSKKAGRILAIEIDKNLIPVLRKKFAFNKKVQVIHDDILKINLIKFAKSYNLKTRSYKIVANIPYYITSPIIRMFLEFAIPPQEMILMVQKEVAERIVAKPGQMSILAVSIQFFGQPELVRTVTKQSFWPKPEVDSAILKITPYQKLPYDVDDIRFFFRMVKAGFGEKRKQLHNSLGGGLHLEDTVVRNLLAGSGIDPKARAQELSVERWVKLYHQLKTVL